MAEPTRREMLMADAITVEDVMHRYPPKQMLNWHPPTYSGGVIAIGRAVYHSVPQKAVDSWTTFILSMSREFAPGNLWIMPTYERLTYPAAVYWPLGCAFKMEKEQGRRFDYYLWADDDVMYTVDDVLKLLKASQAHDAPFMAAVPYDRMVPHSPAIVEKLNSDPFKWVKAPASGSYPVAMTGYNLVLFRRDVFEKVPEPWWGICAPSKGFSGIYPDWWWSIQMEKAGIQPWVCCDTDVSHLMPMVWANRERSEEYLETHDITEIGLLKDKTLYTSPNTGALMTRPPTYPDGRAEYVQEPNLDGGVKT